MRIWVTCACCGHRQALERLIREPEVLFLICHACEMPLRVVVSWELLTGSADPRPRRSGVAH